jgi:hypothetical protein
MKILVVVLVVVAVLWSGAMIWLVRSSSPKLNTGSHHAVLLTNGQVYFGKIEALDSRFPVLTDVYYIQSAVDQNTKQNTNVLLRRGKEWHAPDRMILNAEHIVLVEPVGAGSQVAKLIAESRGK